MDFVCGLVFNPELILGNVTCWDSYLYVYAVYILWPENHLRLVGMGTNWARNWQETHGMLGERLGRGKKQMSRSFYEMLYNFNTHITCHVGAQKCVMKNFLRRHTPNGTTVLAFLRLWNSTIGEVRETPLQIVLHLQLCPLPTPQSPPEKYTAAGILTTAWVCDL